MLNNNTLLVEKIKPYIKRLVEKARIANSQIPPISQIKKIKLLSLSGEEDQKGGGGSDE